MIFLQAIYFFISFLTSIIGSICGIGGGVIIKPVLDYLGSFNVSTITFLSGCTVLSMAIVSMLRSLKSGTSINRTATITLAIGAMIGGVIGKELFTYLLTIFVNSCLVGLIQSIILMLTNIGVFVYIKSKDINTLNINNVPACIIIGFNLGMISSFLGIGGGPINLIVLYYFFSMRPKEAALNSIFIILFSQVTSLISMVITGSLPQFELSTLVLMCLGGICGGIVGTKFSSLTSDKIVSNLFTSLLLLLILLNIYNITTYVKLLI